MRYHGAVHRTVATTAAIGVAVLALAACGSDDDSSTGTSAAGTAASTGASTAPAGGGEAQKVAVLLPDTQSSVRWETADRPLLEAAFKEAGVPV